jgi:hypothetical protein
MSRKDALQPAEQVRALVRRRIAGLRQKREDQWNADAAPFDRDHQDVDRCLAEIPIGAVDGEHPWLALEAKQRNHKSGCGSRVKPHELEEAVEASAHGIRPRLRRHMRRQPPQRHRAETQNQQNQPAQCFLPRRRQRNMLDGRPGQDVREHRLHGTILPRSNEESLL